MKAPPNYKREDRVAARFIERMKKKDSDGLTALYAFYQGPILGMIQGILRDKGAAEEVFQDVFVRAYEQASRFDPRQGTPFTWLSTIARRMAIDRLRRQKRHLEIIQSQGEQSGQMGDSMESDETLESSQQLEAQLVRECFSTLPTRQRQVLEGSFFGGLTHAEIAQKLELPIGTVKSDLRRGLERLRNIYLGEDDRR